MPPSSQLMEEKGPIDEHREVVTPDGDPDAEFGGFKERVHMERKLLWKLDCRMSIMVVIYILNYVSFGFPSSASMLPF